MANAIRISLSGTAQVFCVHDREKRQTVTEQQVAELGMLLDPPILYDPKQHRIHRCACCENLFVDPSDEPRYCRLCSRPAFHPLGGPLPEPEGEVNA